MARARRRVVNLTVSPSKTKLITHEINYTMFVPEGKYYDCNKCGERFWGIAFRVKNVPGVYCLDCKEKVGG